MLRQIVIVLISVAALNGEIWNEAPKKYIPGNEYLYNYDAQILTGIPSSSWQYTGYRLLANVRLIVKSMSEITLRIEQVQFLRINGQINMDEPTVFLPIDLFEEINVEEVAQLIKQNLQRPIAFKWLTGLVQNLRVDKDDEFWSINMKKGLLNMLHMDILPREKEDRMKWTGHFFQSQYEDGIEGVCRSVYHWNRLPIRVKAEDDSDAADKTVAITMTKTRNLVDCIDKPVFEHALFLSHTCDEARRNITRDVIKSETTTHMNLTYWTNKDFFAWTVKTDSRYTFAPVDAKLGSISTFVKQNLTFVRESKIQQQSEDMDTQSMTSEETLQMIVPIPETLKNKEESEMLNTQTFAVLNQIRSLIREKSPKVLTYVQDLVRLLRQSPKSIIEKVHQECREQASEHPEVLELVHDILSTVATKEVVEVIVEQDVLTITPNVDNDADVARRVRMLGFMNHVVHDDLIFTLLKTAENPLLHKKTVRKETFKALLLTIGTLTKTFSEQRINNVKYTKHAERVQKVSEAVFTLFQQLLRKDIDNLKTEERIIVVLKAMGNTGMKKILPLLRDILYSTEYSRAIQVQAIYSMNHLAPFLQREVRQALLPMFFDVTKDVELRIASFVVVMNSKPTPVVLDSIVEIIRNDPIQQVKSFVVSYLKNLASTLNRCHNDLALNITRALETVDSKDYGVHYSHSYGIPLSQDMKAVLHANMIWSPEDFLPRTTNMNFFTQHSGKSVRHMELTLRTDGLQQLLTKLFGPNGRIYTTKNIQDLLKEVDLTDVDVDNRFSLTMSIFGENMGYWALDETLKSIVQQGFIGLSKSFMRLLTGEGAMPLDMHRTIYTDAIIRIPTTFGLPFTANMTQITLTQIRGQITFTKPITDPEMIQASVEITPLVFTEHRLEAGIDGTVTKAFSQIKVEAHIPEQKKWTVLVTYTKRGDKQLRVFVQKPTESSYNIFHFKSTLRNILLQWQPQQRQWQEQKERITPKMLDIKREEQPIDKVIALPIVDMNVKLTYERPQAYYVTRYPINWHLMGDFLVNINLENVGQKNDGLELRMIFNTPKDVSESRNQETLKKVTFKIQLHKTTPKDSSILEPMRNQENSEDEDILKPEYYKNPKFYKNIKSDPIAEIELNVESTKERRFTFRLITNVLKRTLMTLKGEVKLPQQMKYDAQDPLRIVMEDTKENVLEIRATVLGSNDVELLKYLMTVDMDDVVLRIAQRMKDNLEDYRAVHPLVNQCHKDLKRSFVNTPACYFVWRYMNMFNRVNQTVTIPQEAPRGWKNFVRMFMMAENVMLFRESYGMIFPVPRDFFEQEESNLKFHYSSVASPFDPTVLSVNYIMESIFMRFPRVVMPINWLTHLHPSQRLIPGIIQQFTRGQYPATCQIRRVEGEFIQVNTFDGVLYETTKTQENNKGRTILMQDINNNIQVSVFHKDNTKIMQIVVRDGKHIHLIRQPNEQEIVVMVNGKRVTLPLVLKDDEDRVILAVERLPENIYNMKDLVVVKLPMHGLIVRTNVLNTIDIEVSVFYHTLLRGICGNFDSERVRELATRDCRKFFLNREDILRADEYIVKDVEGIITDSLEGIVSNLEKYHSKHSDVFIPLKACVSGVRLMPFILDENRLSEKYEY